MTEASSDVVARQLVKLRTQRDWSAKRLAEECAAIGAPQLTASVIANIESGRRDAEGRRRRDVTVDELLVFAYALAAPPAALMLSVGESPTLDVTPSITIRTDLALRWLLAEDPPPNPDGYARDIDTWEQLGWPLLRYREFWAQLSAISNVRARINDLADEMALEGGSSEGEQRRTRLQEILDRELQELSNSLRIMAERQVSPPPLSDDLVTELERIGHDDTDFRRPR